MFKIITLTFALLSPAVAMEEIIIEKEVPKTYGTVQHQDSFSKVEHMEESYNIKGAFCCRISGTIVDILGSLTAYCTAGLATMSALPGVPDNWKQGFAISAGVGGVITGILHNIKPLVNRIAKEKQERAEALHKRHMGV